MFKDNKKTGVLEDTETNEEKQRDLAKNRIIKFDDGFKVTLQQKDPYGYWSFKWPKGRTPEELIDKSYTTFDAARNALITWARQNDREIASINKGYGVITAANGETLVQ